MNMSKELSYYLLTVNVKLMNTSTLFFLFCMECPGNAALQCVSSLVC